MNDGPYRRAGRRQGERPARWTRVPQRAVALAAGAGVLASLAAPVALCASQPDSGFETLIAGLLAGEVAVTSFVLWLVPAFACPDCARPFLRGCTRCRPPPR